MIGIRYVPISFEQYSYLLLDSLYLLNTSDGTQLLNQIVKFSGVVQHYNKISAEQSIVTVNVDTAQDEFLVFRNDTRQIIQDAQVVNAYNAQRDAVL